MKTKKRKTVATKESTSAFFQNLRPKFLDWEPQTEGEKALEARERIEAKEIELKRVNELAKVRQANKPPPKRR